ncbi:hypothetical protein GW17_00007540 [Ensete ventricosum]|nr:hypothetical protein GW17_00007540 [Ensete ventricosum]
MASLPLGPPPPGHDAAAAALTLAPPPRPEMADEKVSPLFHLIASCRFPFPLFALGTLFDNHFLIAMAALRSRRAFCFVFSPLEKLDRVWEIYLCKGPFRVPFADLDGKLGFELIVMTGCGCLWQAKCLETGETVAIKKVLQDKRYKNRELQLMRSMNHPNVICLKHCFFSTTSRDELFLNLVMEYVPESLYGVLRHFSNVNQRMPLIYVKLYTYQVFLPLSS